MYIPGELIKEIACNFYFLHFFFGSRFEVFLVQFLAKHHAKKIFKSFFLVDEVKYNKLEADRFVLGDFPIRI